MNKTHIINTCNTINVQRNSGRKMGAIALSYPPPIVIDDSSWKNAAESFTVALTLTLGGYESAIAPKILYHFNLFDLKHGLKFNKIKVKC